MGKRNADAKKLTAEMIKSLRKQGWTIEARKGASAWKATPPDGGSPVFFHATPSDSRAVANLRSELRRRGADL